MNSNYEIFSNNEFGQIRTLEIDGKPYFVASDITKILAYKNTSKAIKDHCRYVTKCYIPHPQSKTKTIEVNVIPEGDLYRLIANSELSSAEKFETWIFDEVLPTIRKTGGYVSNDTLFIDTYLPFADDNTKLLFSTTLQTIRKQNEVIQQQNKELHYKQELINGFTDDIGIYTKRAIINRICKRRQGNYANEIPRLIYNQLGFLMK